MLEYRALGALAVVVDGGADVGGPRQRRLLAMLLVHRNTVVPTDRLVDAVFAGEPSPRAAATLRSYVTRHRTIGTAGADALQRHGQGYRGHRRGVRRRALRAARDAGSAATGLR